MAKKADHDVVVIGLGRFGRAIALELERGGTSVLGIDGNAKLVQDLSNQLTHVVHADSTDEDALVQLGVPDFDKAVLAIGSHVESSILTASLLVQLRIPNIWAKAQSEAQARILNQIGVRHVVRPEHDMGKRVAHLVTGRLLDYLEIDEGYALIKTRAPKQIEGKPLGETHLRDRYGVTVVGIKRPGEEFTHATAETVVQANDLIIVSGAKEKVERFADVM